MKNLGIILFMLLSVSLSAQIQYTPGLPHRIDDPTSAPSSKGSRVQLNIANDSIFFMANDSTWYGYDITNLGLSSPAQTIDTFDRSGNNIRISLSGDNQPAKLVQLDTLHIGFACSDETSVLTTGTAKVTYRAPIAMTIVGVRASVNTAPVGSTIIVDINEEGASILGTKLTIDASEKTSVTAAVPAVISDSAIADDAEITIDIDGIGSSTAGKGLKVTLYYIKQ